jgi:hypothetical protein
VLLELSDDNDEEDFLRELAAHYTRCSITAGISPIGIVREFTGRDREIVIETIEETMREINERALTRITAIIAEANEAPQWKH